jgi:hypothetical protein
MALGSVLARNSDLSKSHKLLLITFKHYARFIDDTSNENERRLEEFLSPKTAKGTQKPMLEISQLLNHHRLSISSHQRKNGGEGGIRTHVACAHPLSRRRRYDRFGTSPQ